MKNSPRKIMPDQSAFENIIKLGQQQIHQKLARAIMKTKLANVLSKNQTSPNRQSPNLETTRNARKQKDDYNVINSGIRSHKKVKKLFQNDKINFQSNLNKGNITLLNYGDLQKQVEKIEAQQDRTRTEASTPKNLPYFLAINELKQDRVIQTHETYEQYWEQTSNWLGEKVGRNKNESILISSGEIYRNMVEKQNILEQFRTESENKQPNQYWQSKLREPYKNNLKYEIYQRSISSLLNRPNSQNEVSKIKINQQRIEEYKLDKSLSKNNQIRSFRQNKKLDKKLQVKIANEENLKQTGKILDIELIRKTGIIYSLLCYQLEGFTPTKLELDQSNSKNFLDKVCQINPSYRELIDDNNPYFIEPQFNLLKVRGQSKIKMETDQYKRLINSSEKGKRFYHIKLDTPIQHYDEIILENSKNGMDINYIESQLSTQKQKK